MFQPVLNVPEFPHTTPCLQGAVLVWHLKPCTTSAPITSGHHALSTLTLYSRHKTQPAFSSAGWFFHMLPPCEEFSLGSLSGRQIYYTITKHHCLTLQVMLLPPRSAHSSYFEHTFTLNELFQIVAYSMLYIQHLATQSWRSKNIFSNRTLNQFHSHYLPKLH